MAIYHFSAKNGSRTSDGSARAKFDYVAREGDYSNRDDKLLYAVSANMPGWADGDPSKYWQAADDFERANGRLYKELEISLPIELNQQQQRELMLRFVGALTDNIEGGRLPWTAGVHEGYGRNPHFHLMISERVNDGLSRTPSMWFSRVATGKEKKPDQGGAKKTKLPKSWFLNARKLWADFANEALAQAGHDARIDHRTLAEQRAEALADGDLERAAKLDRAPGEHLGPRADGYEKRTGKKSQRREFIESRQRERTIDRRIGENLDRSIREASAELTNLRAQHVAGLRQKEAIARRIAAERAAGKTPSITRSSSAAPARAPRPVVAPKAKITKIGRMPARMLATLPPDLAKWARESIKQIEDLAKLWEKWKDHLAASFAMHQRMQRAERVRVAAQARANLARPVAPMPVADLAAPPRAASASQVRDAREREAVERRIRLALSTGKFKSSALIDAARLGDIENVDRLIEAGAAPSEKSLDAAGSNEQIAKRMLREMGIQDHVDLRDLSRKVSSPELKAKLEEMATQAKEEGSITSLGIEKPKPGRGAKNQAPGSGPKGP